jgi:hypothetical protein
VDVLPTLVRHAQLESAGVSGIVAKSDLVILQLDQAAIADSHTKDKGGQVFQGGVPISNCFAVHYPTLLPDLGWYLCKLGCLLQFLPELDAKDSGERLHWR